MIYLDNNANTPVDPHVIFAIQSYLKSPSGNPTSLHSPGREAKKIITQARDTIAAYLRVRPDEIIFTSGGTEGANMVLRGVFDEANGHLITTNAEHPCVFNTAKLLEKRGAEVSFLNVGADGAVAAQAVKEALKSTTKLIAIMAVNNETGVKSDIEGIAKVAYEARVPLFVDGVALLGKEPFSIPEGVSAMSFSGQKIHAVTGCGFSFIRKNLRLAPQITGGPQQFNRRAGTENILGIVALQAAIEQIQKRLPEAMDQMERLRNHFEAQIMKRKPEVLINGLGPRICNTSHLYFPGVEGEMLLTRLDQAGVAASLGSACSSGAIEPSRVLLSMGLGSQRASASLRFSLSRFTTLEEIDRAVEIIGSF